MTHVKLSDLTLASAGSGLHLQKEDGSMPLGHNGPWYHQDTPVRTTAHWALIFFKAFLISNDPAFKNAALKACEFLLSEKALYNGYFFCRKDSIKDKTNNLIGQAWAVEPLAIIGTHLKNERFLSFSSNILKKHFFDHKCFLWHKGGFKEKKSPLCRTLNQQIMFATMALFTGKAVHDDELIANARAFFNNACTLSRFIQPGLAHHKVFLPLNLTFAGFSYCKTIIKQWVETFSWEEISIAYLPFILYGFALNHYLNPDESFWEKQPLKDRLKGIIDFILKKFPYGYLEDQGSFRWAYNPVGFEVFFALNEFRDSLDLKIDLKKEKRWAELQLEGYYNYETNLMNKNSCDSAVLMARFYEAIWLPDIEYKVRHHEASGV